MTKNPKMKVWVLCGYYDLATPFFAAEWTYNHLFLNGSLQDNLTFSYYPSVICSTSMSRSCGSSVRTRKPGISDPVGSFQYP